MQELRFKHKEFCLKRNRIAVPNVPGLGVEVDEDKVDAYRITY